MNILSPELQPQDKILTQWIVSTILLICAYAVLSLIIFGSLIKPILILLYLLTHERLPLPDWILFSSLGLGFAFATIGAILTDGIVKRKFIPLPVGAVFISLFMFTSTFTAASLTSSNRNKAIKAFGADKVEVQSFWRSLRRKNSHFTYTHATAIKECEAYIWSYRTMSFHPIKPNTSRNVLPKSWIIECNIP